MTTLATPANMRAFEAANPSRTLPNGTTIEGRRCFAMSINDPDERSSASAGDYWKLADDEPLRDSDGEPMVLAVSCVMYLDALTGALLR